MYGPSVASLRWTFLCKFSRKGHESCMPTRMHRLGQPRASVEAWKPFRVGWNAVLRIVPACYCLSDKLGAAQLVLRPDQSSPVAQYRAANKPRTILYRREPGWRGRRKEESSVPARCNRHSRATIRLDSGPRGRAVALRLPVRSCLCVKQDNCWAYKRSRRGPCLDDSIDHHGELFFKGHWEELWRYQFGSFAVRAAETEAQCGTTVKRTNVLVFVLLLHLSDRSGVPSKRSKRTKSNSYQRKVSRLVIPRILMRTESASMSPGWLGLKKQNGWPGGESHKGLGRSSLGELQRKAICLTDKSSLAAQLVLADQWAAVQRTSKQILMETWSTEGESNSRWPAMADFDSGQDAMESCSGRVDRVCQ